MLNRYAAGLPEIIKNIMWQPCSLSERKRRIRIEKHKRQREGKGFETIEQYQNIGSALDCCDKEERPVVLVECMSNLLANECFGEAGKPDDIFDGCMKLYSGCEASCYCNK